MQRTREMKIFNLQFFIIQDIGKTKTETKTKKKQKKKIKGKNPNSTEAYRAIDHGIGTTSIFLEKQDNMKYKIQKLSPFFSSVSWQLNKV